jgi:hypothetical protein
LHNLALFSVKNANFFAEFFAENIKIIITSVPGVRRIAICTYDTVIVLHERVES